jgi:hypothetical protein
MPITIGSQTNVPDPGSPIASPWSQDTARKLVHTFANVTARDAWLSPPDGAMAVTVDTDQLWQRKGAVWVELLAADTTGMFRTIGYAAALAGTTAIPYGTPVLLATIAAGTAASYGAYLDLAGYAYFNESAVGTGGTVLQVTVNGTVAMQAVAPDFVHIGTTTIARLGFPVGPGAITVQLKAVKSANGGAISATVDNTLVSVRTYMHP